MVYSKPAVADVGSLHDLTLSTINKSDGSGDVIIINGQSNSVPGGSVTGVS
jgi:hypothetical protein